MISIKHNTQEINDRKIKIDHVTKKIDMSSNDMKIIRKHKNKFKTMLK